MRARPEDAGCWIDGHWGHYTGARLIQIAVANGWGDTQALAVADRYMDGKPQLDSFGEDLEWEYLWDAVDEAEVFLNEQIAPDGYSFGWFDGEFFLWSDIQWEDQYGF